MAGTACVCGSKIGSRSPCVRQVWWYSGGGMGRCGSGGKTVVTRAGKGT